MSGTLPTPIAVSSAPVGTTQQQAIQTDVAVSVAQTGAQLLSAFQVANPALYAQLVGSLATYGKSAAAPLLGSLLGAVVAHYGLGPYVTSDVLNLGTEALVAIGTGAGALIMHWWSKMPGRALQTPAPPVAIIQPPPTAEEIAAAVVVELKRLAAQGIHI